MRHALLTPRDHKLARISAWLVACFCVLGATTASAQSRTVCLELSFPDDRIFCPGDGVYSTANARATCNPGGDTWAIGFEFELWDYDATGGDDYIGRWRTTGPGQNCATFNWSDSSDPPDVYVVLPHTAKAEGNGAQLIGQQNNGSRASPSWATYTRSWTRVWGQYNNCGAGQTCRILPGQHIQPGGRGSDLAHVWMVLDSALKPLKAFHSAISNTAAINVRVDNASLSPAECGTGCQDSLTSVHVPLDSGASLSGERASHEIGHLLQDREFGALTSNACSSSWSLPSPAGQKCATGEGWASYVAVASWWDPAFATDVTYFDLPIEDAAPPSGTCADNAFLPWAVTKAFWDLDDANNEGAVAPGWNNDARDHSSVSLLNNWSRFPAGSANTQYDEVNFNVNTFTDDGRNMWDYIWNAYAVNGNWGPAADYDTAMAHNCLWDQVFP
jgi:hypothetical protein